MRGVGRHRWRPTIEARRVGREPGGPAAKHRGGEPPRAMRGAGVGAAAKHCALPQRDRMADGPATVARTRGGGARRRGARGGGSAVVRRRWRPTITVERIRRFSFFLNGIAS